LLTKTDTLDYKKKIIELEKKSKKILLDKNATLFTHCIEYFCFYKLHEDYLLNKKKILNKNFFQILLLFPFRILFDLFVWFLKYLKYLEFYKKKNDLKKCKVLIVSHFVGSTSRRYNPKNDWVFSKVFNFFNKKIGPVKFVLFNFSKFHERKIKGNALFLKKSLNLIEEIKIFFFQVQETLNLFNNFFLKKKIDLFFFLQIIYSVFSFETRNNIRIYLQFKKILKNNNFKYVLANYEGYPWEKILFFSSKEENKNCKTIGYQNTFLSQVNWLRRVGIKYSPDYIFTSGNFNKEKIKKINKRYKKKVFNIGSNRHYEISFKKNKNINCLILPEGIKYETNILLKLSLDLAEAYPEVNFIFRLHPLLEHNLIKFKVSEKLNNFEISKKNFQTDIQRSTMVIYRGSIAVITLIMNGKIPIYYSHKNSIFNTDPIYDTKIKKFVINDKKEFFYIIKNFNYFAKRNISKNIYLAKDYYSKYTDKEIKKFVK